MGEFFPSGKKEIMDSERLNIEHPQINIVGVLRSKEFSAAFNIGKGNRTNRFGMVSSACRKGKKFVFDLIPGSEVQYDKNSPSMWIFGRQFFSVAIYSHPSYVGRWNNGHRKYTLYSGCTFYEAAEIQMKDVPEGGEDCVCKTAIIASQGKEILVGKLGIHASDNDICVMRRERFSKKIFAGAVAGYDAVASAKDYDESNWYKESKRFMC